MNDAEKTEVADIARRMVLAELMPALKELMPTFDKIADGHEKLTATVKKLTATVEKLTATVKEILALVEKLTASVEEFAEGHNEHTDNIEQLMLAQSKTMKFVEALADQYGQIFKALSARIDALEARECGLPEPLPAPRAN